MKKSQDFLKESQQLLIAQVLNRNWSYVTKRPITTVNNDKDVSISDLEGSDRSTTRQANFS
jgi:hypothetical protein